MLARPGVEKGRHVPDPHGTLKGLQGDKKKMQEEAEKARKWVQEGMKADEKK